MKHSEFTQEASLLLKSVMFSSGNQVAFCIPCTLLSTLQSDIDFDGESSRVLEAISDTSRNRTYEYHHGGFEEVDIERQGWFKFTTPKN